MHLNKLKVAFISSILLGLGLTVQAQDSTKQDMAELAKKVANPISNLINIPIRNNSDFGVGALDGSRNTVNIQPVVPFSLGTNLTLLTRTIIPIITQSNITGVGQTQTGLADISITGFFSPVKTKNGVIWGFGPALTIPVATNDFFATKKLTIGPSAIILRQINGFTYGSLLTQSWSVAGSNTRQSISQMFVQPFFSYNWKSGASCGGNLEWTQNWKNNQTIVAFTPTVGGVTRLGKLPVALSVGPRFNIAAPSEIKSDFGVRASLAFLFPK
ncbi:hypothetical protein [Mucilaginibacter jinjuensis]|uniref:Outer membrane beta-barrel porin/alpha-amylase n=1 Tax=Mucilaginibacter jinjuensis TaxID=1176721 RepID=A0ABY7TGW3_9SPHI|nr:hypothetical protein [Mucilaginibacter jinjuensis]WCT14948.1 hypothetical protein PQO05_13480 [Mucilaginibacter jinjuensis]